MTTLSGASAAQAAAVKASASGASVHLSAPDGSATALEPFPSVTLPAEGGRVDDTAPALAVGGGAASGPFGPGLLKTGALAVASEGGTSAPGAATSSASVADVDALDAWLVAGAVKSTCTVADAGPTGAVLLTDAALTLSAGQSVALPADPSPNTIVEGVVAASGDGFTLILNEETVADGLLTVNAVRVVLHGPTAVGDIVLAQASCGLPTSVPSQVAAPDDPPPDEPARAAAEASTPSSPDGPVREETASAPEEPATVSAAPAREPSAPAPALARRGAELPASVLPPASDGVVAAAAAQASEVNGGAFGYSAKDIALFGGAQPARGPEPVVTLPAAGGDESASQPSAEVVYGPAALFTSGPLTVRTQGTTGPAGSVTSTATVENVNRGGSEVFTAARAESTCTASESGVSGSTTVTDGAILTHAQAADHPEGAVAIPTNPSPGHTVEGHLHISAGQDNFRYVFNEQITNPDGSFTVNAVHLYLLGPTATGELIIGQSRCGRGSAGTGTGGGSGSGGAGTGSDTGSGAPGARSGGAGAGAAGAGGGSGASGRQLADTGGHPPTLVGAALVLLALTTRRWARQRPAATPDGRP